ncbi:hypothetical protein V8E53_013432 [Lactarius tabidus]
MSLVPARRQPAKELQALDDRIFTKNRGERKLDKAVEAATVKAQEHAPTPACFSTGKGPTRKPPIVIATISRGMREKVEAVAVPLLKSLKPSVAATWKVGLAGGKPIALLYNRVH